MLTNELFVALVRAASSAPSPDNMQAWELKRRGSAVEVFLARQRTLATDVGDMFSWVGLGAALENLVIAGGREGLVGAVTYPPVQSGEAPAAVVDFAPGGAPDPLASAIEERVTNRHPYTASPLGEETISRLTSAASGREAGVSWITARDDLRSLSALDSGASYVRLEHLPLHAELFAVIRFDSADVERMRYGLDVRTLEVPAAGLFLLKQLRSWPTARVLRYLGVTRLFAGALGSLLQKAGGVCLITARTRAPSGYMEAGRAMQRLWLAATAEGLSVHPFGALPQYLTKVQVEPETFLPRHAAALRSRIDPFFALFPGAKSEQPAIVLRVGRALLPPTRRNLRLRPEELMR